MMNVHWRMAELWLLQQKRRLTAEENAELDSCLKLNAKYAQRLAEQYNYGSIASMTKDEQWLQQISTELDELESLYAGKRPSFFK
ncbi:DUF7667 family protein [Paenibacillus paridis]|uniref:DUF7667 family protein n=1 Tax=Paenibacillus paridis TaxID=2583376 RepID=UPI001121F291|nr:hypothetical protein [Paenibacillus paridis]